jgi:hypothetical protein
MDLDIRPVNGVEREAVPAPSASMEGLGLPRARDYRVLLPVKAMWSAKADHYRTGKSPLPPHTNQACLRESQRPIAADVIAAEPRIAKPVTFCVMPRVSNCAVIEPCAGSTNCGRKREHKEAIP